MALPSRATRLALAAAALAISIAACGDSTGPTTITDPQATIRDLAALDSAFDSDAYQGLSLLAANFLAPTAPAPLSGVAAALDLTLPPAPSVAAARALRRDVPLQDLQALTGTSPALAPVLPDTLLGTTFEWNPDSLRYVATNRTGAPANGIRFILYAADAVFGLPDAAHEVGSLDILDLNPAAGAQLQFVVRAVGGSPTVLDYTLTFLPGNQTATLQASGYVSNGRAGTLERRLTFTASLTGAQLTNGESATVDFTYDVNVPDVTVELHLTSVEDTVADTTITGIDYRFTRSSENIRLQGADTATNGGSVDEGAYAVTVNGNGYATLTIANGSATILDHTGAVVPIDGGDQRYEDEVVAALVLGVLDAAVRLGQVLALPALLLGFSIALL